jgi:hypothetical protein
MPNAHQARAVNREKNIRKEMLYFPEDVRRAGNPSWVQIGSSDVESG